MKLTGSLLTVLLLPSCGWRGSKAVSAATANRSALYDPPTVTLAEGAIYPFVEGDMAGRGQKFHSDYSYRLQIITRTR